MIAGRYIEVDPPNRMAIQRDRQGTDKATPARALIEITFTLKGYSTTVVEVRLSGPSPDDAAFYAQLLLVTLTDSQLPSPAPNPLRFLTTE